MAFDRADNPSYDIETLNCWGAMFRRQKSNAFFLENIRNGKNCTNKNWEWWG